MRLFTLFQSATLGAVLLVGLAAGTGCSDDGRTTGDTSAADTSGDTDTPDTGASDTASGDTGAGGDVGDDTGVGGDTGGGDDTSAPAVPTPTVTTTTYHLDEQMLLANEINESGEPFAEALGYDLDLLDPMVPGDTDTLAYTLGIENYEYSRYQLGTVISRSGIGLHMMWAPIVMAQAAMQPPEFDGAMTGGTPNGFKEDDMLMMMIGGFSTISGHPAPGNPWPQFAEFAAGDPHLPQAIDADKFTWADFSTLRWDRSKMDMTLVPAAMGQSMMKQYLWAQDMLSAYHNSDDEGIEPAAGVSPDMADSPEFDPSNNVFFGGDGLDGFIGMVLTAEAINKVAFLTGALAYDGTALGKVELMTYDPSVKLQFFPHAITVTEAPVATGLPPKADSLVVSDPSSHLFDQASVLWGAASFTDMMDPADSTEPARLAYSHVFDGSPFPAAMSATGTPGPYDLMKGTSRLLVLNILAMHKDPTTKALVDTATLNSGAVTRGDTVSIVGSTYAIVALEATLVPFAGTPIETMAKQQIADQAAFMVASLSDGNGLYADTTTLGAASPTTPGSVSAQAAAVRGLYVAARVTEDTSLRQAADAAYAKLISDYYIPEFDLFSSAPGAADATFTPERFALIAGALREASLEGGVDAAEGIYVGFFKRVASVMQLSEEGPTGETGSDSDGDGIPFIPEQPDVLPPVFATQATYALPQ